MAKGTKFKRKELNQPDQFISTTDVVLAYFSKHKTGLTSVITVLVLIVLFGIWFRYNQNLKSLKMESLYFKIEQIKTKKGFKQNEIVEKIESLLSKFSEGPQKQRAMMTLADQYYINQAYDRSIALYQGVLNTESPGTLPYQLANAGVAYSLEGKKDYKGAIIAYKTIIESHNKYPLFYIYLSLARCYEYDKNQNGALLTLREMNTKFYNHPKIELVELQINKLEKLA